MFVIFNKGIDLNSGIKSTKLIHSKAKSFPAKAVAVIAFVSAAAVNVKFFYLCYAALDWFLKYGPTETSVASVKGDYAPKVLYKLN